MDAFDDPRGDPELLAAIASGDRQALTVLHERHAPSLMLRLGRRCTDPGLVDEAVQDTFVAIWQHADRFRPEGPPVGAWIWTIGIRRLLDGLRRRGRHALPAAAAGFTPAESAPVASAEAEALAGIEHGGLARVLNQLAPELRAVIQATVLDGLTTREAARLLGVPSGTVKTRAMRARTQLRRALAGDLAHGYGGLQHG